MLSDFVRHEGQHWRIHDRRAGEDGLEARLQRTEQLLFGIGSKVDDVWMDAARLKVRKTAFSEVKRVGNADHECSGCRELRPAKELIEVIIAQLVNLVHHQDNLRVEVRGRDSIIQRQKRTETIGGGVAPTFLATFFFSAVPTFGGDKAARSNVRTFLSSSSSLSFAFSTAKSVVSETETQ